MYRYFLFCIISFIFCLQTNVSAETWKEEKGKHFIVQYSSPTSKQWARRLLRKSEQYYDTIAKTIGYARYENFWTWNERVKVIVYPNKDIFLQETGQPAWSRGGAGRHKTAIHSRLIVTYKQEDGFFDGILPHEISHLMLNDFLGSGVPIPLWLDEGIAQLQEPTKRMVAHQIMRNSVRQGDYISFASLMSQDIRGETDTKKVKIFYAQSISIIDFLIKKYGSNKFGQFCRQLKNGKTLEEALRATYTLSIESVDALEQRWVEYMR
ncbi:hypothetical protein MNBD_UNCLBAC01-30 [hydrothermal vent metagenome]|uniref:Peptidase MA-like domain-containing protein n=1 Tax=hydrothermal vent metagenome TaxID=652676 RepID=A0A3B1E147_9ZZZZ